MLHLIRNNNSNKDSVGYSMGTIMPHPTIMPVMNMNACGCFVTSIYSHHSCPCEWRTSTTILINTIQKEKIQLWGKKTRGETTWMICVQEYLTQKSVLNPPKDTNSSYMVKKSSSVMRDSGGGLADTSTCSSDLIHEL